MSSNRISKFRFHVTFCILLGICALLAFVVPPAFSQRVFPRLDALFVPVARPESALFAWVSGHVSTPTDPDRRAADDVRAENQALRIENANLVMQLRLLAARADQLRQMGSLSDRCTPVKVATGEVDSGRGSLGLEASGLQHLHANQPVLCPAGVVGEIVDAGVAGVRVRLITDLGYSIRGRLGYFPRGTGKFTPIADAPQVLVEGDGHGAMIVRLTYESATRFITEARAASGGDDPWVVVDEQEWPDDLQGLKLGHISGQAVRSRTNLLDAELRVEPTVDLYRLREVMVVR